MERKVAIGIQSFQKLREENYFYVDKTAFIRKSFYLTGRKVSENAGNVSYN